MEEEEEIKEVRVISENDSDGVERIGLSQQENDNIINGVSTEIEDKNVGQIGRAHV